MLELRNIAKAYASGRKVFAGLSYALEDGAYVAIMGESGVGKSTLLNLIAGLDVPDTGEIFIDGIAISSLDDDAATRLRRRKIWVHFSGFSRPAASDAQPECCPAFAAKWSPGWIRVRAGRTNAGSRWASR